MKLKIYKTLTLLIPLCLGLSIRTVAQEQVEGRDTVVEESTLSNERVKIGYGEQPSVRVSSAMSTVKGTDLQKSFTSNLTNTLYGRLAGLTVMQNSGEPGNDVASGFGRGIGTYVNSGILVMIDGFENTLEQLVPDEIETISLLKDASATAIYGSRGANGVLLVTTKRGKDSPLVINFSTQQGFHQAHRLPQFLGSYDYARLYNEGLKNDGKAPLYTDAALSAYQAGSDPYFFPNVNWYDEVLKKNAPISNYNLNFRGGNSTVRYFALLNYINNSGLLINAGDLEAESINSNYNRFNFRSNVDINVTDRLTASLTLGGTVEDKANPAGNTLGGFFGTLQTLAPNAFPVRNPDGSFGGNAAFSNPLGNILQTGSYTSNGRTLQSTLKLTNQLDFITQGLSVTGAVSFNNFFRSFSTKSKQYERFSITKGSNDTINYTRFGQKTALVGNEDNSDQFRNTTFQAFLNYDRAFGKNAISAMMMYNYDSYTAIDNTTTSVNSLPFQHVGLGGRLTYANNDKYIAEFSFGYMGSENFAADKRYGFFPAASLAWVASNEKFLKNSKSVSHLKLRASYGLSGNDQIGGTRFAFDQRFPYTAQYYFGTANTAVFGLEEGTAANKNVTWEKDTKLNVGLELTLWKRLDVNLDVFNQDRFDILAAPNSSVPQYVGVSLPLLNQGKVNNRGFEAAIRYNSNPKKAFQFFVEANSWYAKNKIVFNSESIKLYDYQYTTGRPIGQPFGLEALGLFRDAADIAASPRQTFALVQPGDIKYKDQNGDGLIDQNDAAPIGTPSVPTVTLGFRTGFKYKNFDLDVLFQGITGNTVYFGGSLFHAFQSNGKIAPIALDRWTPETAATATYPRLSASNNLNNYRFSSFWQRDGSFLKLRSIELGYTLSQKLVEKIKLKSARLYVNGTNLLSIDKMEGYIDPETRSGYPALRTVSLGIRCQF
jgi:TonB-linked SusC/RagA family outer membrane protein